MGMARLSAGALSREIDRMADGVHHLGRAVVDDFAGALNTSPIDVQHLGRLALSDRRNLRLYSVRSLPVLQVRYPAGKQCPLTPVTQ